MIRVSVPLTVEERDALIALAKQERRDPRYQAAIVICQALERAGYLQPAVTTQGVQNAV